MDKHKPEQVGEILARIVRNRIMGQSFLSDKEYKEKLKIRIKNGE